MRYILIGYGVFIAYLLIQRLRKKTQTKSIEEIFEGKEKFFSWRRIAVTSSILATVFNLLFFLSTADLISQLFIKKLAYAVSLVLVINMGWSIFLIAQSSSLAEYSKREQSKEKVNRVLDWFFLISDGLIIGSLITL